MAWISARRLPLRRTMVESRNIAREDSLGHRCSKKCEHAALRLREGFTIRRRQSENYRGQKLKDDSGGKEKGCRAQSEAPRWRAVSISAAQVK